DDQIALVLPVCGVHDGDGACGRQRLERLLDGVQPDGPGSRSRRHRESPSDSTYFARISTSILHRTPVSAFPRVVAASVAGINPTANPSSVSSATVNETPSTATDPLAAMYRRNPS